jgi:tetratricopeptide (TPR) repeat protein
MGRAREEAARELDQITQKGFRDVFMIVTLWDAVGVPVPVASLPQCLEVREEGCQISEQDIRNLLDGAARGHLFLVEDAYGKPLDLVCTEGVLIARQVVESIYPSLDERVAAYGRMVKAARPEEAKAFLKLLHNMAQRWSLKLTRDILMGCGDSVARLWQNAPAPAILGWGRLHALVGLPKSAEEILRLGYERAEPKDRVYLATALAKVLKDLGELVQAQKILSAAEMPQNNIYIQHLLAEVARQRRDFHGAKEQYDGILKANQGHVPTLVSQAALAREEGNLERAESILRRVLQVEGSNLYAQTLLATVMSELPKGGRARFVEAAQAYQKVLEVNPRSLVALHGLANLAYRRGHLTEAESWLEVGLKIDPESAYFLLTKGVLQAAHGKWPEAKISLESMLELQSEASGLRARVSLANVCIEAGEYDRAKGHLENAQTVHDRQEIRNRRGELVSNPYIDSAWIKVWARQGAFAHAEQRFRKAMTFHPGNVATPCTWAMELIGSPAPRIGDARAVLLGVQEPQNIFSKIVLANTRAEIELAAGELAEAEKHAKRALDWDPENSFTLSLLGKIYRLQGPVPEAEELARKARSYLGDEGFVGPQHEGSIGLIVGVAESW